MLDVPGLQHAAGLGVCVRHILGGDELSRLQRVPHMGVRKADNGDNKEARNLEGAYVGEDTKATIGWRGTSGLWTLGNP